MFDVPAPAPPSYPPNGTYGPPQQYFPHQQMATLPSQANVPPYGRNGSQSGFSQDQRAQARMAMVGGQPSGMFSRNLIGSLAASAFRLSDTSDRIGIWFVLQDLSVRTDGSFRYISIRVSLPPSMNISLTSITACDFLSATSVCPVASPVMRMRQKSTQDVLRS